MIRATGTEPAGHCLLTHCFHRIADADFSPAAALAFPFALVPCARPGVLLIVPGILAGPPGGGATEELIDDEALAPPPLAGRGSAVRPGDASPRPGLRGGNPGRAARPGDSKAALAEATAGVHAGRRGLDRSVRSEGGVGERWRAFVWTAPLVCGRRWSGGVAVRSDELTVALAYLLPFSGVLSLSSRSYWLLLARSNGLRSGVVGRVPGASSGSGIGASKGLDFERARLPLSRRARPGDCAPLAATEKSAVPTRRSLEWMVV